MKSQFKRNGKQLIVCVKGKLDYETNYEFKEDLAALLDSSQASRKISSNSTEKKTDEVASELIFDMSNLDFVGSSGITQFIQTIKEVSNKVDTTARIMNASSDFQKVMKAYDENASFEFFDSDNTISTATTSRSKLTN